MKNSIFRVVYSGVAVFVFVTCTNPEPENRNEKIISEVNKDSSYQQLAPFPEILWPGCKMILFPGTYHGEELHDSLLKYNWAGLYYVGKNVCAIRPMKIKFKPWADPIFNNELSGKEIVLDTTEAPAFLFGSQEIWKQIDVERRLESNLQLLPGKSKIIECDSGKFVISAFGKTESKEGYGDEYHDYSIVITYNEQKQTIFAAEGFGTDLVEISFVGDLNADGVPDLIMDTAPHYNVSRITLFLSGENTKGQILTETAFHVSSGC